MKMSMYLFLDGRTEEAIAFYKKTLGATVGMMMRHSENPEPRPGTMPPGAENKIMHASIKIGGDVLMLSDGHCTGKPNFQGFAMSLAVGSDAEAEQLFKELSAGGHVTMPMATTFFASRFGMCTDKFGLGWMVLHEKATQA